MNPVLDGKITIAELRSFYPALAAVAETGLRNPLEPDEAAWLDGPSFVKWLVRNGLQPQNKLGETIARQVRRWREGDVVNLASADEVLTGLGHHLDDLPEWVWRNRPHRRAPVVPLGYKRRILEEYDAGATQAELERRYGVSVETIRTWRSARKAA